MCDSRQKGARSGAVELIRRSDGARPQKCRLGLLVVSGAFLRTNRSGLVCSLYARNDVGLDFDASTITLLIGCLLTSSLSTAATSRRHFLRWFRADIGQYGTRSGAGMALDLPTRIWKRTTISIYVYFHFITWYWLLPWYPSPTSSASSFYASSFYASSLYASL